MPKYGLNGYLQAKQGHGDELADILLEAARGVSEGYGCHVYLVSRDPQDRDRIWVTEVWESKQAHDDSLKTEATKALISEAMPIIAGAPQMGQVLEVVGGHVEVFA